MPRRVARARGVEAPARCSLLELFLGRSIPLVLVDEATTVLQSCMNPPGSSAANVVTPAHERDPSIEIRGPPPASVAREPDGRLLRGVHGRASLSLVSEPACVQIDGAHNSAVQPKQEGGK